MLTFFFRKRYPSLHVGKLKDLRNPHFTYLWMPRPEQVKALEVLVNATGRE